MIGALSDVGNVRNLNEDYLAFYEEAAFKVYIIPDGMGGHNAGEIASKSAVENTIEYIKKYSHKVKLPKLLEDAIVSANNTVYKMSIGSDNLKGMGTTITACITEGDKYYIANIGDSSCYIIKDESIYKITKDHSLVQELIDEGSITEEQAKNHPNKNIITRALGTNINVTVDIFELDCSDVSKLVLCTDGLTSEVLPEEILEYTMKYEDNSEVCRELVNLAKDRGGRDNITVMVIEGECRDDRNNFK